MVTSRSMIGVVLAALVSCSVPTALPPERAILILVSIDGFRWEYRERFASPTLSRLAAEGVRAEGLILSKREKWATGTENARAISTSTVPWSGVSSHMFLYGQAASRS